MLDLQPLQHLIVVHLSVAVEVDEREYLVEAFLDLRRGVHMRVIRGVHTFALRVLDGQARRKR